MFQPYLVSRPLRRLSLAAAYLSALAGVLTLSGCALAPGGHLDANTQAAPIDNLIDVQPITPGLLATMPHAGNRATPMPSELRQAIDEWEYRIGAGDVLSIVVYDHPELTIPAGSERGAEEGGNRVRSDGTIFYPFAGRVQVAGLTLEEVRELLTQRLSGVIQTPQVDVSVAAFRSQKVQVSGAVASPGSVPVTTVPLTVIDAVSQTGGATEDANWHEVYLTRNGVEQRLSLFSLLREGDQTQNRLLRDGDVLHIPSAESQVVSVMGQVNSPGNVRLGNERLSLSDVLAQAGGVNEVTAEPSGIFVIRGNELGSDRLATVYQLDISNAAAFVLGSRFAMQPNDVVYVTTAPIARWNRVISQLLPSVRLPGYAAGSISDSRDLQ
ncbi:MULTISPECIES: polysaccharide export protein [unclassified Halomonas]|uniref:polysaccharide export protein n=1 Tax=unclassified Halomonas TaxID=2609666 RepID=UPI0021F75594|nr:MULTISPECIES: polysaccharide export protein [unclassified Halomonas]